MKNNIKQLLDNFVHDSKDLIFENADTVANFIIEDTRSDENGYLFFLEDDEKEKFEVSKRVYRRGTIKEIEDFIKRNYNYRLKYRIVDLDGKTVEFVNSKDEGLEAIKAFENFDRAIDDFVENYYSLQSYKDYEDK